MKVDAGLDGLMLATGGVWLECIPHAGKAFSGLFKAEGLKKARRSGRGTREGPALIEYIISTGPSLLPLRYQKVGERQRPARTATLMDPTAARAWLEERLGPLAVFEVEGLEKGLSSTPGGGSNPPKPPPPAAYLRSRPGAFNRPERAHKPDRYSSKGWEEKSSPRRPAHTDLTFSTRITYT